MTRSDLTELDRREVSLWRVLGRYEEALRQDRPQAAGLLAGFRRRLHEYEAVCRDGAE